MRERKIDNFSLLVFDGVYDPAEDSLLLVDHLAVRPGDVVLDVGSGTGITSLFAIARGARRVVAIDISPLAAKNTLTNVKRNGYEEEVDVIIGDLLAFLRTISPFDLVVFNPPYLPTEDPGDWGLAWSGGKTGRKVIGRFIDMIKNHLSPNTKYQVVFSSLMQPEKLLKHFSSLGFKYVINARKRFFFEEIYLVTLSPH